MKKNIIEFFAPMKPPTVTAQEHRVYRGRFYDPPEVKEARMKLRDGVGRFAPAKPLDGTLRMVVKWCFPVSGRHHDGEYKNTKPDLDNLAKMLLDEMEHTGFFTNDARVASLTAEKFWAELPGIYVRIEKIGEEKND